VTELTIVTFVAFSALKEGTKGARVLNKDVLESAVNTLIAESTLEETTRN
jgi:hypothetical protein